MIDTRTLRRTGLALALGLALAACAQQSGAPPAPQAGGMQGHTMSGMSMQQMMAHCAEMRQQTQSGATMSPDMRAMMAHCDQMAPQSGAAAGAGQHRH
ncbi:hypothetical protein [Plastoroseomonas hellenica]|uniref:hypothetical protein n=1 Tax=Plastoroseomonas hellenica TaxID=2687306 RepID=UPI001BACE1E4|nr:hypothetical protein [Plastoroseomonas hellenica]MBR0644417.1 hypothetical protein [Plastoroseomonas hellenica]